MKIDIKYNFGDKVKDKYRNINGIITQISFPCEGIFEYCINYEDGSFAWLNENRLELIIDYNIDDILHKISIEGIESLTEDELSFLKKTK